MRARAPWLVLVAAFVVALAYALVELRAEPTPARDSGTPLPSPAAHGDGLSDSHDGYRMTPVTMPETRGAAVPVAFRILGPDGAPATDYATVQTEPLHLYLLRDDLSGYQHLHPRLVAGAWTTTVAVPDGGAYRLYAEFTPRDRAGAGHPTVLGLAFVIPGDTRVVPLPGPAASSTVDGFRVSRLDGTAHLGAGRASLLRFQVTGASGAPAALEPYLGAYAHMSAFEVLTMGLTHLHPAVPAESGAPPDGTLTFHAQFTNRGEQRLFLQFQVGGVVRQAEFTVFVT